ncbi:hypothetical protein [Rubritalea tangerina]|uniref:hypothetical protein n=1 Tax=Rubritalea tangerina TaxID=430798 RepID=UPI0036126331
MRKINPSYSVSELCAAFGVSRSGFQHYSSDHMTQTRLTKIKLTAEIKAVHNDKNLRVYGSQEWSQNSMIEASTVVKTLSPNSCVS